MTLKNEDAVARHNFDKICGNQWSLDVAKTSSPTTCDMKIFRDEYYFTSQGRYWLIHLVTENGKLRWKWTDLASGDGASEYSRPTSLTTCHYLDRQ